MYHGAAKARIVQLKIKRPTLREAAQQASSEHNVFKFCNNIIAAHRTGAFGGKPALWNFMQDVAANLNHDRRGHRFSDNTSAFLQAMKIFGGRRMCDLYKLNYDGPSMTTIKRANKKGVQFLLGEHAGIFSCIAGIYRAAK